MWEEQGILMLRCSNGHRYLATKDSLTRQDDAPAALCRRLLAHKLALLAGKLFSGVDPWF